MLSVLTGIAISMVAPLALLAFSTPGIKILFSPATSSLCISKTCRSLDLEHLDGTPHPSWPQMLTTTEASAWVETQVEACLEGSHPKVKPFTCQGLVAQCMETKHVKF